MIAKYKAKNLSEKYKNELPWDYLQDHQIESVSIECAKRAVDDIINEWNNCDGIEDGPDGSNLYFIEDKLKYWQNVKNELNNML